MENHGPPPTDPLVRSAPRSDWYRTPSEARPRVETPMVPDLDPDVAMWGNGGVMIWPFAGAPTTGGFQRGQVGVDNTGTMYVCTVTGHPGTWSAVGSGGGGGANSPIVRAFPFAFNTPGILTGAALYTPTVGDILLDAWIEIDTAWNGTTPFGDVSLLPGHGGSGAFGTIAGPVPMNLADISLNQPLGLTGQVASDLVQVAAMGNVQSGLIVSGSSLAFASNALNNGFRYIPSKFVNSDPVVVWVSQDGTNTGADPGSTQGSAILYLVTATPT